MDIVIYSYCCLRLVLEYDRKPSGELGAMGTQIIKRRFETYNKGWLNAMGGMQALLQSHYFDGEMEDESFSGSMDRLPSSQEHELSMLTTARYLVSRLPSAHQLMLTSISSRRATIRKTFDRKETGTNESCANSCRAMVIVRSCIAVSFTTKQGKELVVRILDWFAESRS